MSAPVAPHNLDAEESVLGAILLAGAAGPERSAATVAAVKASGLDADDFYRSSHASIYRTVVQLVERGEPAEVLTVERELRARGELGDAGGIERLAELAALVPATANAPHFARLVVEAAERREAFLTGLELQTAAQNGSLDLDLRERVARLAIPRRPTVGAVEFVTFEEFAAHPEPQAEPLAVDADGGTVIAATGTTMVYGTGGAGKTTLWLDGAMHFAAGIEWLGGWVRPVRKLRVGWIENEVPREEFRRKLERKLDGWRTRVERDRLRVLDQPWSAYDLRRDDHRGGLAQVVGDADVDLLIAGPLQRLGMEGGGTPDEVRAFVALIEDVQRRCDRPVSFVVLHHENRSGQVSGAWEAVPDLLVHILGQGHGKLRVYWQKARWSSALHATGLNLTWAAGEGFALAESEPPRPERVRDDIAAYVLANGGCVWNEVERKVVGQGPYLRERRNAMLREGLLINIGRGQKFELWHRDDPARTALEATVSDEGHGSDTALSARGDGDETATVSPCPVRSRDTERDTVGSRSPDDSEPDRGAEP